MVAAVVKPDKMQIVVTGGTIDKVYDMFNGPLVFRKSLTDALFRQARQDRKAASKDKLLLSNYAPRVGCNQRPSRGFREGWFFALNPGKSF